MSASTLNALLLKLDNAYSAPPSLSTSVAFLESITALADHLQQNPELEINRDIFNGVTNETCRLLLVGFLTFIGEAACIQIGHPSLIKSTIDKAFKEELAALPKGATKASDTAKVHGLFAAKLNAQQNPKAN